MAATNETATLNIEGMMCPHCEAHVKEALNALPGVEVLSISHEAKKAEIRRDAGVTDEQLREAVTGAGYTLSKVS